MQVTSKPILTSGKETREKQNEESRNEKEEPNKKKRNIGSEGVKVKKKKIRRGYGKRKILSEFSMLYSNCRGLKSKLSSMKNLIEEKRPTMICIAETHFHVKEKEIPFKGYKGDVNNRSNDSGGLLIAWREELHGMIKVVHTYKDVGQCIWITLINQKVEARIGLVYAPQESRTSKKDLMKMYSDIQVQIGKAEEYNQKIIILGDFNGKISNLIPGNSDTVSKG